MTIRAACGKAAPSFDQCNFANLSDPREDSAGLGDILAGIAHRPRLLTGVGLMALAYVLATWLWPEVREPTRLLIGWNVGAWAFLGMIAQMWSGRKADARVDSRPEDEGQEVLLVLTIVAALAALGAVVWELGPVKNMGPLPRTEHLLLVAATIVSAWTFIHVMFALHYAGAYYGPSDGGGICGGLKFPGGGEPDWSEFAYQAFVIGCAFATADVNVTTTEMRHIVIAHSAVAFFFNAVIVALTINIAAGLI